MRWYITILIVAVMVASFTADLSAASVSTMMVVKNDLVAPEAGKNFFLHNDSIYWGYDRLQLGLELTVIPQFNSLDARYQTALKFKPWWILTGITSASSGAKFFQGGFWFSRNFGRTSVFIDARNYWSMENKFPSFTENFLEILYPFGSRVSFGADVLYDKWWGAQHDWILAGPVLCVKVSKTVTPFVRISREWNRLNGSNSASNRFRLGFKFIF